MAKKNQPQKDTTEIVSESKTNEIEIPGDAGDEITISHKNGGKLVIKIGKNEIIPDFTRYVADAIKRNAYNVACLANAYRHKQITDSQLAIAVSYWRQRAFDDAESGGL